MRSHATWGQIVVMMLIVLILVGILVIFLPRGQGTIVYNGTSAVVTGQGTLVLSTLDLKMIYQFQRIGDTIRVTQPLGFTTEVALCGINCTTSTNVNLFYQVKITQLEDDRVKYEWHFIQLKARP